MVGSIRIIHGPISVNSEHAHYQIARIHNFCFISEK